MKNYISKQQRIDQILAALQNSPDKRHEVALEFGFKSASTMDCFLRRAGYVIRDQVYVLSEETTNSHTSNDYHFSRAVEIMHSYNSYVDAGVQIPDKFYEEQGFTQRLKMQEFLLEQNIVYNAATKKYERPAIQKVPSPLVEDSSPSPQATSTPTQFLSQEDFFHFLFEHQEQLISILSFSSADLEPSLPSYVYQGDKISRTIYFSQSLSLLLNNYCSLHGRKITDVLNVALTEFFLKYGFEKEVTQALNKEYK